MGFAHHFVFYKLENRPFRKPYLLPYSIEGGDTYSVGSLPVVFFNLGYAYLRKYAKTSYNSRNEKQEPLEP
jgi:hypothetical protein